MLATIMAGIKRGWASSLLPLVRALGLLFVAAQCAAACTPEERNFGGTGGGGGGSVCEPGTSEACYSGPPGTEDTGLCKAGTRACLSDGTGFAECVGEVLPSTEDCTTPEDEACNGADTQECPTLGHVWSKTFGDADQQGLFDVAVDQKTSDIVAVGSFRGFIDFGAGSQASTGGDDGFIAKFDALGQVKWAKRFGDGTNQTAMSVAIGNGGMIYVGGSMAGSVDFGDGVIKTSAGSTDAFLVKLDPDGNVVWSRVYGDAMGQNITQVRITGTGQIVVGGRASGTINFGQAPLTSTGGDDVFVATIDDAGFEVASAMLGGMNSENLGGMAVNALGEVVVTGTFSGSMKYGFQPALMGAGLNDVFIVRYSPSLSPIWGKAFGDAESQNGIAVALNDAGDTWTAGEAQGSIDLGGGPLSPQPGVEGLYLARLDVNGDHVWSKIWSGPQSTAFGARLAIDTKASEIILAGWFSDTLDFGGGSFVSKGAVDAFVARFNMDGGHVASKTFGSALSDGVFGVALLPTRDLIIGGIHFDTIDLGGGPLTTMPPPDPNAFLARLLP
jgi:hypothetical protein